MSLTIGCHLSASKGYLNMGQTALGIGANTFQFFTRNPRGGKAKDIDENDVKNIILSGDRNKAGKTVSPEGLYLNKVNY